MKALVYMGPRKMELQDVDDPVAGPGDVVIASTVSAESLAERSTPSISAPSAAPFGRTVTVCRSKTVAILRFLRKNTSP